MNLSSYQLGVNNFTDMTFDEFKYKYLNLQYNNQLYDNYEYKNSSIPDNID